MGKAAIHKWVIAGDILVAFTTGGEMPDDLWSAMIDDLATKPVKGYLGTSVGVVEVSSLQRRLGAETVKKRGIPSVIITEERLVIGLATAASWLGARIRAYPWKDLRQAIQWLGVPKEKESIVYEAAMRLKSGTPH